VKTCKWHNIKINCTKTETRWQSGRCLNIWGTSRSCQWGDGVKGPQWDPITEPLVESGDAQTPKFKQGRTTTQLKCKKKVVFHIFQWRIGSLLALCTTQLMAGGSTHDNINYHQNWYNDISNDPNKVTQDNVLHHTWLMCKCMFSTTMPCYYHNSAQRWN